MAKPYKVSEAMQLVSAGATYSEAAELTGLTRSAVAGEIYRQRARECPKRLKAKRLYCRDWFRVRRAEAKAAQYSFD